MYIAFESAALYDKIESVEIICLLERVTGPWEII